MINQKVIAELVSTCQFKFLNFALPAIVDLTPSAVEDNPQYMEAILTYGVPSTLHKVTTSLRLNATTVKLFSDVNGLKSTMKTISF